MGGKPSMPLSDDAQFFANRGHVYKDSVEHLEKNLIEKALEHSNGNQVLAAKILGVNRNTLRSKIKRLGIAVDRFKIL